MIDDFLRDARKQLAALDKRHAEATQAFAGVLQLFAEESKTECEGFFGVLAQLLDKVDETRTELAVQRKKEEEDARRAARLAEETTRKVRQ